MEELSRIFGGSQDEEETANARRILEQEGAAKTLDAFLSSAPADRTHRRAKSDMGREEGLRRAAGSGGGTVPYLGTFLTDLTFIDEACPDQVRPASRLLLPLYKEF